MFIRINFTMFILTHLFTILTFCRKQNTQVTKFDYRKEYSDEYISKIYSRYLSDQTSNSKCKRKVNTSDLGQNDLARAFVKADQQLAQLRKFDQAVLSTNSRARLFDSTLYRENNQAKYNEYATRSLVIGQCLGKYESVLNLRKVSYLNKLAQNENECRKERDVRPSLKCDPNSKYRRIDGNCNNIENPKWGAVPHCQRRLLPPDYSDGVSRLRKAANGSPLPCPRRLSKQLFNEKSSNSRYTSLQTMWGQLIAHDTFNRVVNFGGEVNCCPVDGQSAHPECLPILGIPRDNLSMTYEQNCINFVRALACDSCQLGPRNHINHVTSYLDLSQVYGLSENISRSLRTFTKGQLRIGEASDGSHILQEAKLPHDQDRIDLSQCNPAQNKQFNSCFKNGDGIRGNQNPAATSLVILFVRRHNQHANGLARANPSCNDERLFQEARRLLIAEYNRIVFGEYLPTILSKHLMKKFDLKIKKNGFTEYDSNVDPSGVQSVGGAALRFGHLTTKGLFHVSLNRKGGSYAYKLKDKFMEMSDIWEGRTNGIIRGLTETATKQIAPNFDDDLQDHLFFNKVHPQISDLAAFNILRGRDYGLPSYAYYLEYLKGVPIKSWNDLKKFIPERRLNKLKAIYNDFKDIDLYVGGALEEKTKTFQKLMGIQFFHWKFGDRFYFEHSGQPGSFTISQLNNIRGTASLANLLCKTTDFESIASKPFLMSSSINPKTPCNQFKEFNYNLFH